MNHDSQLLRINYEVAWNCDHRCRYCYRFLTCPDPEKEALFHQETRFAEIRERMRDVRHKVAVMAGKGGVGKTTVTVGLALQMARQGRRVGILDVDFSGPSVVNLLGLQQLRLRLREGAIIPATGPYGLKVISHSFSWLRGNLVLTLIAAGKRFWKGYWPIANMVR